MLTDGLAPEVTAEQLYSKSGSTWSPTGWRDYVLGATPDERLIYLDETNTVRYPHTDKHGSTVALAYTGTAQSKFRYGPFGESSDSPSGAYTWRYTGQRIDAWTGLYWYKAREYSPTLGRFLQADPAGFVDGPDLYTYVGNDPEDLGDPSGMRESPRDVVVAEGKPRPARPKLKQFLMRVAPKARVATAVGLATMVCGDTPHSCGGELKFWAVTYTKTGPGGVIYTGMTSGVGETPAQVLASCRPDRCHHMNEAGFGDARLDKFMGGRSATLNNMAAEFVIRGREQMMIYHYGGARKDGGTSGNANRAIARSNPMLDAHIAAAEEIFGKLSNNNPRDRR